MGKVIIFIKYIISIPTHILSICLGSIYPFFQNIIEQTFLNFF